MFSCAPFINKNVSNKENKIKIIKTQQWNIESDSINLYLNILLPINKFVFIKNKDHFSSAVIFTLVVSDFLENKQVYRETWDEMISEAYYENTRDPDNYFQTERNIILKPGQYKIFLNIQDKDSHQNWKINEEVDIERTTYLGSSLLFAKNQSGFILQSDQISQGIDTLWLRTQVNISNNLNKVDYFISFHKSIIDSGSIQISNFSLENLFYLPVPFNYQNNGEYEIQLNYMNEIQRLTFYFGDVNQKFWTNDISEIIGVMNYILPYSKIKMIKSKSEADQWEILYDYWKSKDPDPETKVNELLDEFNNRVKFTNKNFSILMHGWRTDRGRTYIIYGEPQEIDDNYDDSMGYKYQKWTYLNGKEFVFIDRTLSGDYTLYRERF